MALITTVTLDETVTMEAGKSYGLLVAKATEVSIVHPLVTSVGSSQTVTLGIPVDDTSPTAPEPGDHIAFGLIGAETINCLIRDIEPTEDYNARIILVPEAKAIHNAGNVIPDFDPGITPTRSLPAPIVTEVISDSSVMIVSTTGALIPRVVFNVEPIDFDGYTAEVYQKLSDTDAEYARSTVQSLNSREIAIVGVAEGETYDFILIYTHPEYFQSQPSESNAHFVSGRTDTPSGLTGLTINAIGGNALLRWNKIPDVDVRFGGKINWRWSSVLTAASASWPASVPIGDSVDGSEQHVFLPLKPGTYLARVKDSGDRFSDDVAKISTKQASVLTYSNVDEVVEHPTFSGTLDGLIKDGTTIKLGSGFFDDVPDVDALLDWDEAGVGITTSGQYDFAAGMDFGSVSKVRLTSHIVAVTENTLDLIDDWDEVDARLDMDGATGAPIDAWTEYRQTDDDPTGSPTWSEWDRLDASEVECWGVEFRLLVESMDRAFNFIISELSVSADEVA